MKRTALAALCGLLFCGCAGEIFRSFPPEQVKQVRVDVPIYSEQILGNGLRLVHYRAEQVPQVVVQLSLRVGTAALPLEQAGLISLWLSTIAEADREEQKALDGLGTLPDVAVDPLSTTLTVTVADGDAEQAIATMAKLIRAPQIDEASFERRRARLLTLRRAQTRAPFDVARRMMRKALYGPSHPLAQSASGTLASLSRVTLAELQAFQRTYIGPANLAVVIAGAITEADARAFTEKAFGDWQAATRPPPEFAPPQPMKRSKVYFVPLPGLNQTVLTVGGPAPAAGHQDELPFLIAANILRARIQGKLRGQDNVSYGTQLHINAWPSGGHFSLSNSVEMRVTGDSLQEMMSQSFLLAQNGFFGANMPRFRLYAFFDVSSPFSTLGGIADFGGELFCFKRPVDYPRQLVLSLSSINADQVQNTVSRYLDRDNFQIVVIADRSHAEDIAKLKLGPLEFDEPQ